MLLTLRKQSGPLRMVPPSSKAVLGSTDPALAWAIPIVLNRGVVVQATGFLVVRWVVQAPLGCGDFLRERFGIAEFPLEAFVVWHGWQCVLHDDIILVGDERIVGSARRFRWALVVPVHVLVISYEQSKLEAVMSMSSICSKGIFVGQSFFVKLPVVNLHV